MLPLLLGSAAAGVVGNLIAAQGQKKAAETQAEAIQSGQDIQMQMFQEGQQATQPFREAGTEALGQYQQLLDPQGQADFFANYQRSPMFQALRDQAEQATLRSASATGGLRTGQAGAALSAIAPQLAMQAIQQRMGGLQNIINTGAGAAGQTAGLSPQVGAQQANLMTQQGAAQAAANQAMPQAFGQSLGQLGGLGMYAAQGGFGGAAPGAGGLA